EGADVKQLVPAQRAVEAAGLEGLQQQVLGVAHAVGAQGNIPPGDRRVLFVNGVAHAGGYARAGGLDRIVQPLVHVRLDQIVRIDKADIAPARVVQPDVRGRSGAAVGFVEHADARVGLCQLV